ncbi:Uncharacterised protein [Chlamydia trachomatis]|nr:Uncharacterised protein [Chlamydia trachomatis]
MFLIVAEENDKCLASTNFFEPTGSPVSKKISTIILKISI